MKAYIKVLDRPPYHGLEMAEGLKRLGYQVSREVVRNPSEKDILVIWNRYNRVQQEANAIEAAGGRVVVVENGYFGRNYRGGPWYAVSLRQHAIGGLPKPDIDMWRRIDYPVKPWRTEGSEYVILAQRGIGSDEIKSPPDWHNKIAQNLSSLTDKPMRIRPHPGAQTNLPPVSFGNDLDRAEAAITWASSAGIKAILEGTYVYYGLDGWIGGVCASHISLFPKWHKPVNRNQLLARLATAMWNLEEMQSGEGFRCLLE